MMDVARFLNPLRPRLFGVYEALFLDRNTTVACTDAGQYGVSWSVRPHLVGVLPGVLSLLADGPRLRPLDEAWESLATRDLIPPTWINDPQRSFACAGCRDVRGKQYRKDVQRPCALCGASEPTTFVPRPSTAAEMAAFASAAEAIVTAEALAREAVAALRPWGCAQPTKVKWRFVDGSRLKQLHGHGGASVGSATACAIDRHEPDLDCNPRRRWHAEWGFLWEREAPGTPEHLVPLVDSLLESREEFETCQMLGLRVLSGEEAWSIHGDDEYEPSPQDPPSTLVGRRFADLPNPYTAKLALWDTGLALDSISKDAIHMLCPLLSG